MEQTLMINFYNSVGRGVQNMWICSEHTGTGVRFEINNAEDAGKALQEYLEKQESNNIKIKD